MPVLTINTITMLFDKTVELTDEEKANPLQVFQDLFIDYKPQELHNLIAMIVEVCVTSDNTEFSQARDREDLFTSGRHLQKVILAAHFLVEQRARH